ncbi:hypothetical protein CI105_07160 [Candidatus Izimaplasma bacterium ZiA1]|uniref:DNA alkylation repair protein n=1 Tax=Candidatus Izimoplasma sp. ZiA1 TaxID=2024899 RepID=UPI000BAA896E|nr:hypothetical protein CI105_07160 [Candidatus Izimaplasma bacterium ZiA1]
MVLKDELFNKDTVNRMAIEINKVEETFNNELFVLEAVSSFPNLELKERMSALRVLLKKHLPDEYLVVLDIFKSVSENNKSGGFVYGAFLEYIECYGCNDNYVDKSLEALSHLTKLFSAEFAIREYLNNYPIKTLACVMKWSLSDNEHIRRLASEGTRPKLPWAKGIRVDYNEGAKALDNLYFDKSRYVTRSTANHLNDISKINPEFVLMTLKRWIKSGKQNDSEMKYIINHSLRTLIKKGHKETLEFLGFKSNPDIKLTKFDINKNILNINDKLTISVEIKSKEDVKLVVDYIVLYPSKTKKMNSKTYKLKSKHIKCGEVLAFDFNKQFKDYSTRKMNEGEHKILIQINGSIYAERSFQLKLK